jgi:transcription initiation factor TFIIA large subunit
VNNLTSKYGPAAAGSVSQLQAQSQPALSLPGQHRSQDGQLPDVKPPIAHHNSAIPPKPSLSNGQTDGTDEALLDWKAEVSRRRAAAQRDSGQSCSLLDQVLAQNLRLEGGGLMLPLEEHDHLRRSIKPNGVSASRKGKMGQSDGLDDDAEGEDEDAINSELDDPDDLIAEDREGEEAVGQVMLCTYDKVQRVKNKWKCTLKDGILTTGGKELVDARFQKNFSLVFVSFLWIDDSPGSHKS